MIHHGNKINDFEVKEFSEDPHDYAHPRLMTKTQRQRDIIGAPMHPSPTPGALARFGPDDVYSHHYAGDDNLSKALDWFCDAPAFTVWNKIITSELWRGMGIYFDTHYNNEQQIMFHTDFDRRTKVYWFRYYHKYKPGGVYVDSKNDSEFWEKLNYFFYLNYKKKDFEGWQL